MATITYKTKAGKTKKVFTIEPGRTKYDILSKGGEIVGVERPQEAKIHRDPKTGKNVYYDIPEEKYEEIKKEKTLENVRVAEEKRKLEEQKKKEKFEKISPYISIGRADPVSVAIGTAKIVKSIPPGYIHSKQDVHDAYWEAYKTQDEEVGKVKDVIHRLKKREIMDPETEKWEKIKPEENYTFIDEFEQQVTMTGEQYFQSRVKPEIKRLETWVKETGDPSVTAAQKAWAHTHDLPPETKARKTIEGGYEFKIPDTSLKWSKGEIGKIKRAPPVIKEIAMFGFGAVSTIAALGKPIAQPIVSATTGKTLPHYVSGLDIAFEPIGWSPKGSTKLIGTMGPAGWAGVAAGEFLQAAGFHYAFKGFKVGSKGFKGISYYAAKAGKKITVPVVSKLTKISKTIPGRAAPYSPSLIKRGYQTMFRKPQMLYDIAKGAPRGGIVSQFVFESPKRYGLKGVMTTPYYPTGKISFGMIGVADEPLKILRLQSKMMYKKRFPLFWEKTGLVREVFTDPFEDPRYILRGQFGRAYLKTIPKTTEYAYNIGRISSERVWAHAGFKGSQKIAKGITTRVGAIAYDPVTRQFVTVGKKRMISRPFGFLRRKLTAAQQLQAVGLGPSYEDVIIKTIPDKLWKIGKETPIERVAIPGEKYIPQYLRSQLKEMGYTISKAPKPGFYRVKDIIKISDVHTGGFPTRIHMSPGERRLLNLLESLEDVYKPISKITPKSLIERFPKPIIITPKPFILKGKGFVGFPGALGEFGRIGIGGISPIVKTPIKPESIIATGIKYSTLMDVGFKSELAKTTKPAFDISYKYAVSPQVTPITKADVDLAFKSAQLQDMQQLQKLVYKQQTSKITRVTRPKLHGIPFWFPGIGIAGRGPYGDDLSIYGKKYGYRKFKVPGISEVDKKIMKNMFKVGL